MTDQFPEEQVRAFGELLRLRRDIRHFRPDPVPEALLQRLLEAAHVAPSVGLSQPWRFVRVEDGEVRQRIRSSFLACREAEASRFEGERREQYLALKLEGIVEAPLNLCVCADLRPRGPILGTTSWPEALRWSVCCAVQNLWLMARAEGVGVGWVSIAEPQVLRDSLELPYGVEPMAYLCVGYPHEWMDRPLLASLGWEQRLPLEALVHQDAWQEEVDARLPWEAEQEVAQLAAAHRDALAKPPGSLGQLEDVHGWYVACRGEWPHAGPGGVGDRLARRVDHGDRRGHHPAQEHRPQRASPALRLGGDPRTAHAADHLSALLRDAGRRGRPHRTEARRVSADVEGRIETPLDHGGQRAGSRPPRGAARAASPGRSTGPAEPRSSSAI